MHETSKRKKETRTKKLKKQTNKKPSKNEETHE